MEFDKSTIVDFLKQQGRNDDADKAAGELPDKVDTEKHAGLLSRFGINPNELLDKLPGGIGEKLGGFLGNQ